MIDRFIAGWVNAWTQNQPQRVGEPLLTIFEFTRIGANHHGLNHTQVPAAAAFTTWAQFKAEQIGALQPGIGWTVRDVEMAIFTACHNHIALI